VKDKFMADSSSGYGKERPSASKPPWVTKAEQDAKDRRTASRLTASGLSYGQIRERVVNGLGEDLDPTRYQQIMVDVLAGRGRKAQKKAKGGKKSRISPV